MVVDLIVM